MLSRTESRLVLRLRIPTPFCSSPGESQTNLLRKCSVRRKGLILDGWLTLKEKLKFKYFKTLGKKSFYKNSIGNRSKKNYNPAACGPKTTVTERQRG